MWKSKFYGAFVLNRRVDLYAIDATPARWRGDAGSSPLDGASTAAHPTHWLISTQVRTAAARVALDGTNGRARLCGNQPVRRVPITTPSSRRRVDGVEDDATIQHERAVKF